MQKGSLVILKNTVEVFNAIAWYTIQGRPFPRPETVYVMAADIRAYKCGKCEETHTVLMLEEIPDIEYNSEYFDEIQTPEAVNINQLVQETEFVHTP